MNQFRSRHNPFVAKNSMFDEQPEVIVFLEQMNRNAAKLHLKSTFYDSPHGLNNPLNKSTAFDVAKLGAECMKDARFRRVVSTHKYVVKRKENEVLIRK
jgi:D-alanyl-D-alanine carboxypeptidase